MIENLRGKCKELSEALCAENPDLELVKGWYNEPMWTDKSKMEHWWCVNRYTGEIVDPAKSQFPSGGLDDFYEEFEGTLPCEECGKEGVAEEMLHEGRFHFCDQLCYCRCVGIAAR